jgi:hypothetical protein
MFKRKKYIRLDQIPAAPKSAELKRLLFESKRAPGCTVELPWRSAKTGLRYSITVCYELGGHEPIWSLYQGEGAQSRMIWTQTFKDPELLSDVINLSLPAEAALDNLEEKMRSNDRGRDYNPNLDRSEHTYSSSSDQVELLSLPPDTTLPQKPNSETFHSYLMTEADMAGTHSSLSEPTNEFSTEALKLEEPVPASFASPGASEYPAASGAFPIGQDPLLQGQQQQPLQGQQQQPLQGQQQQPLQGQQQPAQGQQPAQYQAQGPGYGAPNPQYLAPGQYPGPDGNYYPPNYNPAYPPQDPSAYQGYPPGYPGNYPPGYPGGYPQGFAPQQYPPVDPAAYAQGYPPPGYPQYPPGYVLPPGYPPPPGYPVPPGYPQQSYPQAQQGSMMVPRVAADSDLITKRPNVLLGDFLVETGLIPQPTLDAALQLQEMVRNGALSTTQAAEAVRRAHNRGGEVEQFTPSAPPADSTGAKVNAPPLGEILVEAGLIRLNILKAALNLQEVVRTGALSKEEAVEAFIQEHFGKAGKQGTGESSHDQNILELVIKAKLIQRSDLDAAIAVKKKHGGDVSKILEAAGKVDKITYEAAGKCQTLLEEKRIKIEQAIIALHYCQRSRVSFDDAIVELGWEKP